MGSLRRQFYYFLPQVNGELLTVSGINDRTDIRTCSFADLWPWPPKRHMQFPYWDGPESLQTVLHMTRDGDLNFCRKEEERNDQSLISCQNRLEVKLETGSTSGYVCDHDLNASSRLSTTYWNHRVRSDGFQNETWQRAPKKPETKATPKTWNVRSSQ